MLRFLMSRLRGGEAPSLPPQSPLRDLPPALRMVDVEGMIRQASIRVGVDQLVKKGKRYVQLLSCKRIEDLINRSVRTIVDKHRATDAHRNAVSAAQIEAESRAEFQELLHQYQETAAATSAVEESKEALEREVPEEPEPSAAPVGDPRDVATLKKRVEKLLAYIATMEAVLKTLSTAKTFSNQQVQNLLRDLGLSQEDKNFEKKKEMLKVVLDANQGIRRRARELAARGVTLDAPEEKAMFTMARDSSGSFSRSPV